MTENGTTLKNVSPKFPSLYAIATGKDDGVDLIAKMQVVVDDVINDSNVIKTTRRVGVFSSVCLSTDTDGKIVIATATPTEANTKWSFHFSGENAFVPVDYTNLKGRERKGASYRTGHQAVLDMIRHYLPKAASVKAEKPANETPEAFKTRVTAEVNTLKTRIATEQDGLVKKILQTSLARKEKLLKPATVKIAVKDDPKAKPAGGKNEADLNREKAKNISKLVREGAGA